LTARLRGLCREHAVFLDHEEAFSVPLVNSQSTNPVASASGTTPYVHLRARRSALPNSRELGLWPVLRYLGAVEAGDRLPSKGRNVTPNSLMVEVSAVGSPADDTLQREVVELMELLHPLVIPGRVDHARLACR
uniref:APH domain-containing protein n=1 Tax=Hydatigena taeniaeformis TaxID=6205 RepID=A0A0R3XD26_HYDTA